MGTEYIIDALTVESWQGINIQFSNVIDSSILLLKVGYTGLK